MSAKIAFISIVFSLVLCGCDAQGPKIEAMNNQSKILSCSLNGSPAQILITKNSLDSNLLYQGRVIKVNLIEVKDFYQIIMRFDPQIGQLKINKLGNELTQLKSGNEQVATCVAELTKS